MTKEKDVSKNEKIEMKKMNFYCPSSNMDGPAFHYDPSKIIVTNTTIEFPDPNDTGVRSLSPSC